MGATVPPGTLEPDHKPVEIAPIPVLPRFVPPYSRVPGHVEVRSRMPDRRVVTASGVTAFLADPQMHPVPASLGQAVLATPGRGRDIVDPAQMRAAVVHVKRYRAGRPVVPRRVRRRRKTGSWSPGCGRVATSRRSPEPPAGLGGSPVDRRPARSGGGWLFPAGCDVEGGGEGQDFQGLYGLGRRNGGVEPQRPWHGTGASL